VTAFAAAGKELLQSQPSPVIQVTDIDTLKFANVKKVWTLTSLRAWD
jgi:hypothetical protein